MNPPSSSPVMPTPHVKGHRSYLKCNECRLKKRKCDPEDRNWDERQERCRNCDVAGLACGPNEPFRSRLPHAPSISSTDVASAPFAASSSTQHPESLDTYDDGFGRTPATRDFAASPVDYKKQRLFNGFEAGSETRIPSAKDSIRARLIDLGNLCDLYYYVQSRQHAVLQAQSPRLHQEYKDIYDLVTTVLDYARNTYAHNCDHVINALPHASRTDKELFLRTLVDKTSHFLSACHALQQSLETRDADDFWDIKEVHCRALCQLATICDEAGDYSDAYRYRCQLESLSHLYNMGNVDTEPIRAPKAFISMSGRISDAFHSLKIPNRFARLLPRAHNMFPAFHLAMHKGQQLAAHNILVSGLCNAEERDIVSRQAIHIAAETGDLCLLQLALQDRVEARSEVDVFQMTALFVATYMGNSEAVNLLVESGSDYTVTEVTGRSILCIAAGKGHLQIVEYLLQRGHRSNVTNQFGSSSSYSALHAAAAGGHRPIVDLLLRHGASALFLSTGLTPAEEALAYGQHVLAEHLNQVEREQRAALPAQLETSERAMHRAFLSTLGSEHLTGPLTSSPSSLISQPVVLDSEHMTRSASLSLSTSESSDASPLLLSACLSGSPSTQTRPRKRPRPSSCHPTTGRGSPLISDLLPRATSSSSANANLSLGKPGFAANLQPRSTDDHI